MDHSRAERRRDRRIPLGCKVAIRVEGTREPVVGVCVELSVGGMTIQSSHVPRMDEVFELVVLPLGMLGLARLIGLPALETMVIVLLGSIGLGANVFLMARQFKVLEGPVAGSLLLSTMLSALTTPLIVSLMG